MNAIDHYGGGHTKLIGIEANIRFQLRWTTNQLVDYTVLHTLRNRLSLTMEGLESRYLCGFVERILTEIGPGCSLRSIISWLNQKCRRGARPTTS